MFSFLRSSQAGLPDNPVDVANRKNEKDFGITAEKPLAELDSDLSSNDSPGERTFEESMSRWTVLPPIESLLTCFHTRYGRWNGSPFGCIQLHNAHVSTLSYSCCYFPSPRCYQELVVSSAQAYSPRHRLSLDPSDPSVHL